MKADRIGAVLLALWICGVLPACDDDEGGLRSTRFPELIAEPNEVVLSGVAVGGSTSQSVVLKNAGGSRLRVTEISFSNEVDTREFRKNHPQVPFVLEAEETTSLVVNYAPVNAGEDLGEIRIISNDPGSPLVIPIVTREADAQLVVSPDRLLLRSNDGEAVTEEVTLQNLGAVPVEIQGVALTPDSSADFSLAESAAVRPTLAQGERVVLGVIYQPTGQDGDTGTLRIATSDPNHRTVEIPLIGQRPAPEIEVSPNSVVFGAVDPGTESDVHTIVIENLGTAPLYLQGLDFSTVAPGINDNFRWVDRPNFADGPIIIEVDASLAIGLKYVPLVEGSHRTGVVVRTDDLDEPTVIIPVEGRVRQRCISVAPTSLDFGRVALTQDSAHSRVQVVNCGDLPLTLSEIVLEGEGFSLDVAGETSGRVIEPLGALPIEVWYTNRALAEGLQAQGKLRVLNDSPNDPDVEVPLLVTGGGTANCELLLMPNRVDFGLVSRGSTRTRELQLLNRGTGRCELRGQQITPVGISIPGFNDVHFIITHQAPFGEIAPGAFVPIELAYRPQAFIAEQAKYVVTYFDPFQLGGGAERTTEATLVGVGGESNIEVIPGGLNFGQVTAGQCASQEERVTVYNTGIVDLCINDIRLEGSCDEFIMTERPIANADGCIIVTRARPANIALVYEPSNLGVDECTLVFSSDASDTPEMRVSLDGEGIRDRNQVDVFEQQSGQQVDVLFVIDNSGSMGEEQDNVRDNFAQFIQGASQFQNDYQIGVITCDMDDETQQGRLQGEPAILRRNVNVEDEFAEAVDVGTDGSGEERGLEAAQRALSDPLAFDTGVACSRNVECIAPDVCVGGVCGGPNRGFLRETAALEVIFVSDEEDQSPGTLDFYVDFFKNIKGFRNEGLFHAHAIVGTQGGEAANCSSANGDAAAGRRYVDVATRTNGAVFSICEDDFGEPLRSIGTSAFGLPVQFFLSRPAVRATVEVTVDGQLAEGWVYEAESNSIIFDEAHVPQAGQSIRVSYEAQCFPRQG